MKTPRRIPAGVAARFAAGEKDITLAKEFGVDRHTVAAWRRRLADQIQRIEEAHDREHIHRRTTAQERVTDDLFRVLDLDLPGDPDAAAKVETAKAKAREQLIKLYGMDAPSRVEHSGPQGGAIPLVVTDEVMDRMLAEARKRAEKAANADE